MIWRAWNMSAALKPWKRPYLRGSRKVNKMRSIVVFLLLLVVTGCASVALSPQERKAVDYGPYPDEYKQTVKDWFYEVLKDPDSAKYRFVSEPEPAYSREAPVAGGDPIHFGYYVKVLVNAKNSYGGYTGWKDYRLIIRDGQVVARITPNPMYFEEPWYQ